MFYRLYLIVIIILISLPAGIQAADRYRVEVLVLQHLNSTKEAKVLSGIRDYSPALDFLAAKPDEESVLPEGCEPEAAEPAAELPAEVLIDPLAKAAPVALQKSSIEERAKSPHSIMPVGFEALPKEDLKALVEYMAQPHE